MPQPNECPSTNKSSALLILSFATVYILWGSTYLAMRIGVETFPPFLLPSLRHFAFGILIFPIMLWKTSKWPTTRQWKTAFVSGSLLCLANGSVCWAEKRVPSGIAALIVATVSLWMVVIDWLRPGGIRPTGRVFAGIVTGFAGLVVLISPAQIIGSDRVNLAGALVLVLASLSWAAGSVYAKHGVLPESMLIGSAMQSLCGGAVVLLFATVTGELRGFHFADVSFRSWLALGYLLVFGSLLASPAYLYMLKNASAARASTYAFVNPVVALFFGWLVADEQMSLRALVAAGIILGAVILVITARQPAAARVQEELASTSTIEA